MEANYDKSGCGGKRFSEGKLEHHLIPAEWVEPVVRVMMMGKKKYGEGNWEKGMSWMTIYNCLQRHIYAWRKGENIDPESGEHHMAHVICNAGMLISYALSGAGVDNRKGEGLQFTDPKSILRALDQLAHDRSGISATPLTATEAVAFANEIDLVEKSKEQKSKMTEEERNEKYGPGC